MMHHVQSLTVDVAGQSTWGSQLARPSYFCYCLEVSQIAPRKTTAQRNKLFCLQSLLVSRLSLHCNNLRLEAGILCTPCLMPDCTDFDLRFQVASWWQMTALPQDNLMWLSAEGLFYKSFHSPYPLVVATCWQISPYPHPTLMPCATGKTSLNLATEYLELEEKFWTLVVSHLFFRAITWVQICTIHGWDQLPENRKEEGRGNLASTELRMNPIWAVSWPSRAEVF